MDVRSLLVELEQGRAQPPAALEELVRGVHAAPTSTARIEACRVIGSIAGRAFGASWPLAERAAFALLDVARETDSPAERAGLLGAMGRAFRNQWLVPYVHTRMSDDDADVVVAAIGAAGGLALPALEEAIASRFLAEDAGRRERLAAIAALGRMGAVSAAKRLAPLIAREEAEATAALGALSEMRARAGEDEAVALLERDPPLGVLAGAARYLAEMGRQEVLPLLRRLARDERPELRAAVSLAFRAYEAERAGDVSERILAALTERDRAVRALLARRLRTVPVGDVLEQAEVLLADDPEGVIQVIAEVRAPEVTRLLMRLGEDASLAVAIRARAVGSVEANEAWERDALVALLHRVAEPEVKVAAAHAIGAFAPPAFVMDHLAPLADHGAATVRGALLWALQLAAHPVGLSAADRARAEGILRSALADPEASVRRRAAYVAGNLDAAALVPDLVKLARGEPDAPDLRLAAFVGLGEIGSPDRLADLVHLWNKDDDPAVVGAASRAIEQALRALPAEGPSSQAPKSLARVFERLRKLVASEDPKLRAAAARIAGLTPGSLPIDALAALAGDETPRVREQAVAALGRLREGEAVLSRALDDADPAVQERAAAALLALGAPEAVARVIDFASRSADRSAAARLLERAPAVAGEAVLPALDRALGRVGPDDATYEALLELKLAALEQTRPAAASPPVDEGIAALFPTWTKLSAVRGFAPLAKSLRTAEMLHASTRGGSDTDCTAPIVLWMKCLEGYLHAWLAPRFASLQERPAALWELTERAGGSGWGSYHRWLAERWEDPVSVGELAVEVPVRSSVNALRELMERRNKPLDSPWSVTEWSRMMLFFAVDHPSGARNVLKVGSSSAERTVRLAHQLAVLAQVRNTVAHRAVAALGTLTAFRAGYYAAFEDLTQLA
jgi:HEAT repeat protein